MDINVQPVFLYYLIEAEVHFLVNSSFVLISHLCIFHSWDSIFEGVPRRWRFPSFQFLLEKVISASFIGMRAPLSWVPNIVYNITVSIFAFWIFLAVWFQSLMKFIGRAVPSLSSFRHLVEEGSLMTTGHVHERSEPCRISFEHSSHRWRASHLGLPRSSQNAQQ